MAKDISVTITLNDDSKNQSTAVDHIIDQLDSLAQDCRQQCATCKFWNNSDQTTSWNKQHKDRMQKPYKEFGECSSEEFIENTFFDVHLFGYFTHKSFGCIFYKRKLKS